MDADFAGGIEGGSSGDKVIYNSDGGDSSHSTDSAGSHNHALDIASFTSGSTGSGSSFSIMPPYFVLAYIIRVQ